MNRARRGLLHLACLCLAAAMPMAAQPWCSLSGKIVDASTGTVPDAAVSVIHEDTGFRRVAESGMDGMYRVGGLQPGTYKVTIRKDGFRTVVRFGVRLDAAESARLDFQLVVGSVQETITVNGEAGGAGGETAVGVSIERDEIEHVPENGHGLQSLLALAPGLMVTPATRGEPGQFTVDGQRPNTNYFLVDGVSANTGVSGGGMPAQSTGGALPGMSAFGSLHSLIALEGLQEMRVDVSTAAPQFGRLPGAQVSLSSRSGSNDFHGSLFYSARTATLDATDWFSGGQPQPERTLPYQDFGAGVGGALWRNHTFFFLSYEGMRLRQGFASEEPVPSVAARDMHPVWAQSVLSVYPAPTGPELGAGLAESTVWSDGPGRLDVGSLRVDHAVTSHFTVFGRYNLAPSLNEFGSAQVSRLDLESRALTFGGELVARPDTIFEARFNRLYARVSSQWTQADPVLPDCYLQPVTSLFLGQTGGCQSLVRFSIGGVSQVVSGDEGVRSQSQMQAVESASLNRGGHAFRIGTDYLVQQPIRRDAGESLGILAENVEGVGNFSGLWIARAAAQDTSARVAQFSAFAQDTWRITERLTASYGLRWEFSPAPISTNANFFDPKNGQINPATGPIWRNTYRNFAPRVGLAYRLDRKGSTVLRAGMGRYFDSSLSIATDLINGGPLNLSLYSSSRIAPFVSVLTYGFLPDLRLPIVTQYSGSIEHAFSGSDTLTIVGTGSSGNGLVRREIGGLGSSQNLWVALTTNDGASDYHALHVQYRRRLTAGLQGLATYTWSHSIDNSSSDSELYWAGAGLFYWNGSTLPLRGEQGPSDFDVRHALNATFTYEVPRRNLPRWAAGWAVDGTFLARTGFPINVLDAGEFQGLTVANAFRPNVLPGQPVWITDADVPGGRRLNPAAFQPAANYVQGNLGRNAIAGFGMSQLDMALRRNFGLGESRALEFRVEAFNALNHPNFADPVAFLNSPLFGQSASMLNAMLGTGSPGSGLAPMFQSGGARAVQVDLRFRF